MCSLILQMINNGSTQLTTENLTRKQVSSYMESDNNRVLWEVKQHLKYKETNFIKRPTCFVMCLLSGSTQNKLLNEKYVEQKIMKTVALHSLKWLNFTICLKSHRFDLFTGFLYACSFCYLPVQIIYKNIPDKWCCLDLWVPWWLKLSFP